MADPETLPLAVEIADLVADAGETHEALDIKREAKRLVREHPEAEVGVDEVAEVLKEERTAAIEEVIGTRPEKPAGP